jgi:hypothetical protein
MDIEHTPAAPLPASDEFGISRMADDLVRDPQTEQRIDGTGDPAI